MYTKINGCRNITLNFYSSLMFKLLDQIAFLQWHCCRVAFYFEISHSGSQRSEWLLCSQLSSPLPACFPSWNGALPYQSVMILSISVSWNIFWRYSSKESPLSVEVCTALFIVLSFFLHPLVSVIIKHKFSFPPQTILFYLSFKPAISTSLFMCLYVAYSFSIMSM